MQQPKPLKVDSFFIWKARISLIKSVLFNVKGKGRFKLLRRKDRGLSDDEKYILSYNGIKFILTSHHGLGLLSIPYYEPRVYDIILSIRGDIFIDIGSFEGGYALFTYKNFKEIVTVEPSPDNLKILEENIRLNNINNVKTINKAISSKRGRVKLYLADNPYNSSIVFKSNNYVEVDTITLDELLSPYDVVDLIKIDVEGAELDVIESGITQLHKAKKIIIEVRNQYESNIDNIMMNEGFKKRVLEDRGHEKNILYYVGE